MNRPVRPVRPCCFGLALGVSPVRPALLRAGKACAVSICAAALLLLAPAGCFKQTVVQKPKPPRYENLPGPTDMPMFMTGSIYERTVPENFEPANVSSFALVGQLRGTGDTSAANSVRTYMIKEMQRHQFGSGVNPVYASISAGDVLRDPNYAIVRVDGALPPGARKGDWVDVTVSCLPENKTSSLAHGVLFETDLRGGGATAEAPGLAIHVLAKAKGPIFVNPAYALFDGPNPVGNARASLRKGNVLQSGKVLNDRPLMLRLRQPERRLARRIEQRIRERFQLETDGDLPAATGFDEGIIQLWVPKWYRGDWNHFLSIVTHLYLQSSPDFNAARAKKLVAEAKRPGVENAVLADISFCWEGIGKDALPFIMPLLTHPSQDVAYQAARAAAFIGDNTGAAEETLARMARTPGHPHRVTSVRTLGGLQRSSALNYTVRNLLNADLPTVRIEAYKVLARNEDSSVYTRVIYPVDDRRNEKFILDIVPSDGPPLIYATRKGMPRIAIIGKRPDLRLPISYSAMGNRLTISSSAAGRAVTLFYRDASHWTEKKDEAGGRPPRPPVKVVAGTDVAELIARLGGGGEDGDTALDFSYGEVIAIIQALAGEQKLVAVDRGQALHAAFMLEEADRLMDVINSAPVIGVHGPADGAGPAGSGPGPRLSPSPGSGSAPVRNSPSLTPLGAPPAGGEDLTPRQNPSNLRPVSAGSR